MKLATSSVRNVITDLFLPEQYEQSVTDFKECLKIQKEYLDADSRLIAETHYQIGLACVFSQRYDESIESFKAAVDVIQGKISKFTFLSRKRENVIYKIYQHVIALMKYETWRKWDYLV